MSLTSRVETLCVSMYEPKCKHIKHLKVTYINIKIKVNGVLLFYIYIYIYIYIWFFNPLKPTIWHIGRFTGVLKIFFLPSTWKFEGWYSLVLWYLFTSCLTLHIFLSEREMKFVDKFTVSTTSNRWAVNIL